MFKGNCPFRYGYLQFLCRPSLYLKKEPSNKGSVTRLRCVVSGKALHKTVTNFFQISNCDRSQNFLKAATSSLDKVFTRIAN